MNKLTYLLLLISVTCRAQVPVAMISSVRYEYIDGLWRPIDSAAYTYTDGRGSIDTAGEHYAACGFDTRTSFHRVKKKYKPYERETVHYDTAEYTAEHTVQIRRQKKWIDSLHILVRFDRYGDTVNCMYTLWDSTHSEWGMVEAIYFAYDSMHRCIDRIDFLHQSGPPYISYTVDSMRYDETGLLAEHLRWHEDSGQEMRLMLHEAFRHDEARRLICRTEYLPEDSIFIDSLVYDSQGRLSHEYLSSRHPARHSHMPLGDIKYEYNERSHSKGWWDISYPHEEPDSAMTDMRDPLPVVSLLREKVRYEMDANCSILSIGTYGRDEGVRMQWDDRDRTEFKRHGVLIESAIHIRYDIKGKYDYNCKVIPDEKRWHLIDAYHYHYQTKPSGLK